MYEAPKKRVFDVLRVKSGQREAADGKCLLVSREAASANCTALCAGVFSRSDVKEKETARGRAKTKTKIKTEDTWGVLTTPARVVE